MLQGGAALYNSGGLKILPVPIWFFCDACHKLEVDKYYLARSGVDIIETGWNLSLEKVCKFDLSKCSWFDRLRETNVWAALSPDEQTK
jgi:hypothetical protein